MSSITVARLALTTVLLWSIAGVAATPAAAEPSTTSCASGRQILDPVALILPLPDSPTDTGLTYGGAIDAVTLLLQEQDSPTTSCQGEMQGCMSASAQEGMYGERFVPPDAVATCMAAYRACIAEQPEDGGAG